LVEYRVLHDLRAGREDDDAFLQGIGFADLTRLPSKSSAHFCIRQCRAAVPDLLRRLSGLGRVPIIFRYKTLSEVVEGQLRQAGHEVLRIPSPPGKNSDPPRQRVELMRAIQRGVGTTGYVRATA
jgi:hypothetical protein